MEEERLEDASAAEILHEITKRDPDDTSIKNLFDSVSYIASPEEIDRRALEENQEKHASKDDELTL